VLSQHPGASLHTRCIPPHQARRMLLPSQHLPSSMHTVLQLEALGCLPPSPQAPGRATRASAGASQAEGAACSAAARLPAPAAAGASGPAPHWAPQGS
jgi:hypothetical protein